MPAAFTTSDNVPAPDPLATMASALEAKLGRLSAQPPAAGHEITESILRVKAQLASIKSPTPSKK